MTITRILGAVCVVAVLLGLAVACDVPKVTDLGLGLVGPYEVIVAGDRTWFSLHVTNHGQAKAENFSVYATLPAGVSFVGASSYANPNMTCSLDGQTVWCRPFELVSGGQMGVEITVDLDRTLPDGAVTPTGQIIYLADTRQDNNNATLSLAVRSLVTQDLDYEQAKNAGATFADGRRQDPGVCRRLGVGDWLDPRTDGEVTWEHGRRPGVVFMADCGPDSGEAFPEAFANFTLKNGWKVVSVEEDHWNVGLTAFSLDVKPDPGSCRPRLLAHIRSYGMSAAGGVASFIRVGVRVRIEGPNGTDPYRGTITCGA